MQETIKNYLNQKGIEIIDETKNEIIIHCAVSNCDNDSHGKEAHMYISKENGQWQCKKCGESGNMITLKTRLGDIVTKPTWNKPRFNEKLVQGCHDAIPYHIRQYLNARGIIDALIDEYMLGYGNFYGINWITIPIKDESGDYKFFKLRQDPNSGKEKSTFPSGHKAQIYDWSTLNKQDDKLVICEGELDRLVLLSKGINAITSTHGAGTFNSEWIEKIKKFKNIYLCFDRDEAGRNGALRVARMLDKIDHSGIFLITLPEMPPDGKDVTDYFAIFNGNVDDLFNKYASVYPEPIDTTKFKPLTIDEIKETLGLTIKKDDENKIITFLCQLTAYTDNAQFNVLFQAPSSSGKSHIPVEIVNLFPQEDVLKLSNVSPTAFFHEQGEYDKEKNEIVVDLSRKIIVFLDIPHFTLLEKLRSLLSHDDKETRSKITDKNQSGGNRTKTVVIRGFPSVILCSANLKIDEQEATRFILLSPEIDPDKIQQGIHLAIIKESDRDEFQKWLDADVNRKLLTERIRAIRQEKISEIKISNQSEVEKRFLEYAKHLKPRHQRDVKRIISIIKAVAMINLWWRERAGSTIMANDEDVDAGFKIWEKIAYCQELQIPPYVHELYKKVILAMWSERKENENVSGLSRREIAKKYYKVYGLILSDIKLRQSILPVLEAAGLIFQEPDSENKKRMLIYPMDQYSESNGGSDVVEKEDELDAWGNDNPA